MRAHIADVDFNGTVDTSTALYDIYNTNNPRSVATVNGSSFYLGGQGVKGDTTQGVFTATDGASSRRRSTRATTSARSSSTTAVSTCLRTRKQPNTGGTSNISSFATPMPTGTSNETPLPGISQTVTLTAARENSVNASAVGTSVHLSPENYVFANSTTLYVPTAATPSRAVLATAACRSGV